MNDYTEDSNGNPALIADAYRFVRTEPLPYTLGNGTVRRLAREVSDKIITDARTLEGPVVWITSNQYMPPMRAIPEAEHVYQAENNAHGELWAFFVEEVEDNLARADVILESPEWDNALYVVDTARWVHKDTNEMSDDISDEWERK